EAGPAPRPCARRDFRPASRGHSSEGRWLRGKLSSELTQALARCLRCAAPVFARRIAGGRPEESRVLAKPRSAADVQQRVREEAVGGAFDQLLFDQAVAPGSWDCAFSVVRTRER